MDLRDQLLQALVTPQAETRFGEPYLVGETARASGHRLHEVWEALWGSLRDGLIYLDPAGQAGASSRDNWKWRPTQTGIRVATGGPWEPRDPTGYLRRLREHSRTIDKSKVTPDLPGLFADLQEKA